MDYQPELNQFSDVSFWYQRNCGYWCSFSQYGDTWWLSISSTMVSRVRDDGTVIFDTVTAPLYEITEQEGFIPCQ